MQIRENIILNLEGSSPYAHLKISLGGKWTKVGRNGNEFGRMEEHPNKIKTHVKTHIKNTTLKTHIKPNKKHGRCVFLLVFFTCVI